MEINLLAESIAKEKEKGIVYARRDFGKTIDDSTQIKLAFEAFEQGRYLDEESAWAIGIGRLSEKVGRLRHGAYSVNGRAGRPVRIVQWAPEESRERCIYAGFNYAPFEVQKKWEWIIRLSDNDMKIHSFLDDHKSSDEIPGQLSFSDLGFD